MPKETSINFDSGSNYNYHFITKKLAERFEEQFTCLEETTEKYITFLVPIEKKVTRIGKNEEDITKTIPFSLKLLIAQDLWRAHYHILSKMFGRNF